MACLDDCAEKAADSNAVRSHVNRDIVSVRVLDSGAHGLGILGSKIEYLSHLDAPRGPAPLFRNLVEQRLVMGFVGSGIARRELLEHGLALRLVAVIDLPVADLQFRNGVVEEDL